MFPLESACMFGPLEEPSNLLNLPVQEKFGKSRVRFDAELRLDGAPPPRLIPDVYSRQLPESFFLFPRAFSIGLTLVFPPERLLPDAPGRLCHVWWRDAGRWRQVAFGGFRSSIKILKPYFVSPVLCLHWVRTSSIKHFSSSPPILAHFTVRGAWAPSGGVWRFSFPAFNQTKILFK